jgi:hypothetical protein
MIYPGYQIRGLPVVVNYQLENHQKFDGQDSKR